MVRRLTPFIAWVAPLVLLLAAIGKYLDWENFEASVASFVLLSPAAKTAALYCVPGVEILTGLVAVIGRRRAANAMALLLMLVFSAVIGWHWLHNIKPTCACMGLWTRYLQLEDSFRVWLLRNGVIAAFAVAGLMMTRPRLPDDTEAKQS